ncbi:hypothetical protein BHM03_00062547, partial [Ensete ventricosum]
CLLSGLVLCPKGAPPLNVLPTPVGTSHAHGRSCLLAAALAAFAHPCKRP